MRILFTLLIATATLFTYGQNSAINGVVKDKSTGETLIGANIVFADNPGKGTITDIDGNFSLKVEPGTYEIKISYIGFKTINKTVKVGDKPAFVNILLQSDMLDEVEVVADIAVDRKTPVAHMNIKPAQIAEELSGRDLPMILNSTPGVYATTTGGEGDAEVRIRGFKGNFVGVLLDGIPVNDMENGWVYWSNWFGLSSITRNINIQRGLGASKLAIPSIGGTINILTKGIENKRSINIKQELDEYGKYTTSAGYNSGQLKNGWSVTLAAAYKTGSGWIQETDHQGYFYFAKVNKRWKKHLFSFTTFGAPQWHEQRKYGGRIVTYDSKYAEDLGIDLSDSDNIPIVSSGFPDFEIYELIDKGFDYNPNWGYLARTKNNPNAEREVVHTQVNRYYKPMFYLKDFWTINDKMAWSNIAYMSIGRGGGISGIAEADGTSYSSYSYDKYAQINLQTIYDNQNIVDPNFHPSLVRSRYFLPQNTNNHMWYGWLSTFNHKTSVNLEQDAGIDVRYYKGTHYREIADMLGGDYFANITENDTLFLKEGDKVYYHDDAYVSWAGAFYQAEYSTPLYTALINITGNVSSFKKEDYWNNLKSKRKTLFGWTIKGGFNYNLTETINIFTNAGYYDKVQGLSYIYQRYSTLFSDIDNEKIKSVELGLMFKGRTLKARVNAYYTVWDNKPSSISDRNDDDLTVTTNTGLKAIHKGIEFDLTYNPIKQFEIESWVSIGDWRWDSKEDSIALYNQGEYGGSTSFDVRGVHVSDAAQTQLGLALKFKPIKGAYVTVKSTYFDRYFAQSSFDEIDLDEDKPKDSWKTPSHQIFDLHAGYRFSIPKWDKINFKLTLNLLNFTDEKYISAARNNDPYAAGVIHRDNDAKSATVFFGAPRRFVMSFGINF